MSRSIARTAQIASPRSAVIATRIATARRTPVVVRRPAPAVGFGNPGPSDRAQMLMFTLLTISAGLAVFAAQLPH